MKIVVLIAVVAAMMGFYLSSDPNSFNETEIAALSADKTFVITGANSGIGFGAAEHLVKAGTTNQVIVACRSATRCQTAVTKLERLRQADSITKIRGLSLDLSSLESIEQFVEELVTTIGDDDKITLINNAGIMGASGFLQYNRDTHVEIHMHVNHLGHFYLTHLLMKSAILERIVSVSSCVGSIPGFWDMTKGWYIRPPAHILVERNWLKNLYFGFRAYGRSKRANLAFVSEFNTRYPNISAMATHPGATCTELASNGFQWSSLIHHLGVSLMEMKVCVPANFGSLTTLRAALCNNDTSGSFIGPRWLLWGPPMRVGAAAKSWHHWFGSISDDQATKVWTQSEEALDILFGQ